MDDACAWFPESHSVTGGCRLKETVHFSIGLEGCGKVGLHSVAGTDEMVAVHGCRHGNLVPARVHELEHGHLCGGILHRDPVGTEEGVVNLS